MFDKSSLLKSIIKPDEKLIFAKAFDQAYCCLTRHETCFTDFLDPYKVSELLKLFSGGKYDMQVMAFGGTEACERKVVGFGPPYMELTQEEFPICMLEISYNATFSKNLTHRDFLGSVLGLGIERTKIGDILLLEGKALAFVYQDIADYICYNLDKVSHTKVTASIVDMHIDEQGESNLSEKNITVSSLRVDTVLSGAFNLSRSKVSDYIQAEKVFVNWTVTQSQTKILAVGDMITLRGVGRVKLIDIVGKSKKDKFVIQICKY